MYIYILHLMLFLLIYCILIICDYLSINNLSFDFISFLIRDINNTKYNEMITIEALEITLPILRLKL